MRRVNLKAGMAKQQEEIQEIDASQALREENARLQARILDLEGQVSRLTERVASRDEIINSILPTASCCEKHGLRSIDMARLSSWKLRRILMSS